MCQGPSSTTTASTDDPVALARGWLARALETCGADSDGALALCAAWDQLDLTGSVGIIEPGHPGGLDVTCLVDRARSALRESTAAVPQSALLPLARTLDHLDDAAAAFARETSCDGPPWR